MKKRNTFNEENFKERFFVFQKGNPSGKPSGTKKLKKRPTVNNTARKKHEEKAAKDISDQNEKTVEGSFKEHIQNILSNTDNENKRTQIINKEIKSFLSKNTKFTDAIETTEIINLIKEHPEGISLIEASLVKNQGPIISHPPTLKLMIAHRYGSGINSGILGKRFDYYTKNEAITNSMLRLVKYVSTYTLGPDAFFLKILKEKKEFTKNSKNAGNFLKSFENSESLKKCLKELTKTYGEENLNVIINGWEESNTSKKILENIYKTNNKKIFELIDKDDNNTQWITVLINNLAKSEQDKILAKLPINKKIALLNTNIRDNFKEKIYQGISDLNILSKKEITITHLNTIFDFAKKHDHLEDLINKIKTLQRADEFLNQPKRLDATCLFINNLDHTTDQAILTNFLSKFTPEQKVNLLTRANGINKKEIVDLIFKDLSPEEKLKASGFEITLNKKKKKIVQFNLQGAEEIKRSFIYNKKFKDKITKLKTIDEVKLATYSHLKNILARNKTLYKKKYIRSNEILSQEIDRLKNPKAEVEVEEETGAEKPEVNEAEKLRKKMNNETITKPKNWSKYYLLDENGEIRAKEGKTLAQIWKHLKDNEGSKKMLAIISKKEFFEINGGNENTALKKGKLIKLYSDERVQKIIDATSEKVEEKKEANKVMTYLELGRLKTNLEPLIESIKAEFVKLTKEKKIKITEIKIEKKGTNIELTIQTDKKDTKLPTFFLEPTTDGQLILSSTGNKEKITFNKTATDHEIQVVLKREFTKEIRKKGILEKTKTEAKEVEKTKAYIAGNVYWFTTQSGKMVFVNEKGKVVDQDNKAITDKISKYEIKAKEAEAKAIKEKAVAEAKKAAKEKAEYNQLKTKSKAEKAKVAAEKKAKEEKKDDKAIKAAGTAAYKKVLAEAAVKEEAVEKAAEAKAAKEKAEEKTEQEKLQEKAVENHEKREKLKLVVEILKNESGVFRTKLKEEYPHFKIEEAIDLVNTKVEITMQLKTADNKNLLDINPKQKFYFTYDKTKGFQVEYLHFYTLKKQSNKVHEVLADKKAINQETLFQNFQNSVLGGNNEGRGLIYEMSLYKRSLGEIATRTKDGTHYKINTDKITEDYKIKDKKIAKFKAENWEKEWQNIDGHEEIERILKNTFGVKEKAHIYAIVEEMVTEGWNDQLDLDDVLKALEEYKVSPFHDSERRSTFEQIFTSNDAAFDLINAMSKLSEEIYKLPEGDEKRIKKENRIEVLYTVYRDAFRLIKILTGKDVYIKRKSMVFAEKHRSQIDDAKIYTPKKDEKLEYIKHEGIEIAINDESYKKFTKLYKEITKKTDKPDKKKIIEVLLKVYGLKELLVLEKTVEKTKERKLVIKDIPETFLDKSKSEKLIKWYFLDKQPLEDEEFEYSIAFHHKTIRLMNLYFGKNRGSIKTRYMAVKREYHAKVVEELILRKTRENLKTQKAYKDKLLLALKAYELDNKGALKILGITFNNVLETEEITLRGTAKEKYIDSEELRRKTSPEALVDHIFSNEFFKVKKGGETISFRIFKFENDLKIINEEGIKDLFNYLIDEGNYRLQCAAKYKKTSEGEFIGNWSSNSLHNDDFDMPVKLQALEKIKKPSPYKALEDIDSKFLEKDENLTFLKDLKKHWETLKNYKNIERLFYSSEALKSLIDKDKDGEVDEKEKLLIPYAIYEVLKKEDPTEINIERIVQKLMLKHIKSIYKKVPEQKNKEANKIKNYDMLVKQYEHLRDTIEKLQEKKADKEITYKEKEKLEKYIVRFKQLKKFVDTAILLTRELEGIETKIPKAEHIENFLTANLYGGKDNPGAMNSIINGYILTLERDRADQDRQIEDFLAEAKELDPSQLSPNPYLRKIQEDLAKYIGKNNITKKDIYSLEKGFMDKIGILVSEDAIGLGTGVAVPLGKSGVSLTLGIAAGWDHENNQPMVGVAPGISWQINDRNSVAIGTGISFTEDGPVFMPGVSYKQEFPNGIDMGFFIGALITPGAQGFAVGITIAKDKKRAVESLRREKMKKLGFENIEEATSIKNKATLIRENGILSMITDLEGGGVDDTDLVAIYEFIIDKINLESIKEGSNGLLGLPITAIGVGFIAGNPPAIFFGLKITLFSYTMVKPKVGERERMAKHLSGHNMYSKIMKQLDSKTGVPEYQKDEILEFLNTNDRRLYLRKDGRVGLLDPANSHSTLPLSNLGNLNRDLKKAKMKVATENGIAKLTELEVDGKKKKAVELIIQDTYQKDIEVYVDPSAADINIVLTENNKIMLASQSGNLKGLIITRERFHYPYREHKGGATAADVIIISRNHAPTRNAVENHSRSFVGKRWIDNESKQWEEEKGIHQWGTDKILYLNKAGKLRADKKSKKDIKWKYENYKEKLYDMDFEEVKKLHELTKRMGKNFVDEEVKTPEALEELPVRENFKGPEGMAIKIYKKLKRRIRGGKPNINDAQGIIKKANQELAKMKPKQKPLNQKEVGQLIMIIHHEYFSNLFAKQTNKGLIAKYKSHNSGLKSLYRKEFGKSIKRYGLKSSASKLTKLFMDKNEAKFIETIKGLTEKPPEKREAEIKKLIKKIAPNTLFYSGTSIRTSKVKLFASAPYETPFEGIDTLGLIGGEVQWKIDSNDQAEKDIALIMLETMSPKPSLKNHDTLLSPMAIELSNFIGAAIELGEEKYTRLIKFYEAVNKSKNKTAKMASLLKNSKTREAVKEFTELATKVRNEVKKGLPAIITLKNGGVRMAYGALLKSGSYGKCGNTSMLMREAFAIVNEKNIIEYSSTYVHSDSTIEQYDFDVPVGVVIKLPQGSTPTTTTTKVEGGGDATAETNVKPVENQPAAPINPKANQTEVGKNAY